ncbi:Dynein light chain [Psidium guajava]|nr:Dynein light chain [Psidium guajava]
MNILTDRGARHIKSFSGHEGWDRGDLIPETAHGRALACGFLVLPFKHTQATEHHKPVQRVPFVSCDLPQAPLGEGFSKRKQK